MRKLNAMKCFGCGTLTKMIGFYWLRGYILPKRVCADCRNNVRVNE